jgi:hypothetical protein
MADDWWREELGVAAAEARRLAARVGSAEILPYFSGWVRRTRDRVALLPLWREWARRWSCRPAHVQAVLSLENGDRDPTRAVLDEDIGVLDSIRRSADPLVPPAPTPSEPPWCSVFLSYCHGDADLAAPVVNAFTFYLYDVWFDRDRLQVGDSLRRAIDEGMSRSRNGILLVTPTFLDRTWPRIELDGFMALATDANRQVIPICIGVAPHDVPGETKLADFLAAHATWLPANTDAWSAVRDLLLPTIRNLTSSGAK